jgi:hypothetical protein
MTMNKHSLVLRRVAQKLEANRQDIFMRVSQENPENFDIGFNDELDRSVWENHQRYPEMFQREMETLVVALEEREKQGLPCGPIEQAALDYVALVTGCEGPTEHIIKATCHFRCPSLTYEGTESQLQARLRVGVSMYKELIRQGKLEDIQVLALSVEALEGEDGSLRKCQVTGRLQFKLTVFQDDGAVPSLAEALTVILSDDDRVGAPHRLPLLDAQVIEHLTK